MPSLIQMHSSSRLCVLFQCRTTMASFLLVLVLTLTAGYLSPVDAAKKRKKGSKTGLAGIMPDPAELICSACDKTARRLEKEVFKVDEKASLQVGGRLQKYNNRKKIKFGRSETRIFELLEDLCQQVSGKYRATAMRNGRWSYITQKEMDKAKSIDDQRMEFKKNRESEKEKFKQDMINKSLGRNTEETVKEAEKQPDADAAEVAATTEDGQAPEAPSIPEKTEEEKAAEKQAEEIAQLAADAKYPAITDEDYPSHLQKKYEKQVSVGEEKKQFRRQCDQLLEDHEEAIVAYLHDNWDPNLDLRNKVCVDISKSCPTRMVKREQPPAADAGQGDADSQAAAKKEHEEL